MSSLLAKMSFQRWLGVVLVVLSVLTIALVAVQTSRLNSATECQAAYNDAYTKAIQARSSAARDERQAQRELLATFFSNGPINREQAQAAYEKYLASLDEADQKRDEARIPTRRC